MAERDGWDRLGDRAERSAGSWADDPHPLRRAWKWIVGAIVVIAITAAVLNWFGAWGGTAARLTGPAHSEQQITAVLDDWRSLQATAGNVCDAKGSGGSGDPTLVERPDFAYRATYRRVKADYDRRMGNLFEAYATRHLPLPGSINNLPTTAPSLTDAMRRAGC